MWQAWLTQKPTLRAAEAALEDIPSEYRARCKSHINTAFGARARVIKTKKRKGLL